eukprot:GEMP01051791.1.p1 GENE.GEMP01051791.1~~GEMP01051791.1.p1  ORF type:complete len:231 (-),score=29.13 GEMP01051791.1:650-1342(-)
MSLFQVISIIVQYIEQPGATKLYSIRKLMNTFRSTSSRYCVVRCTAWCNQALSYSETHELLPLFHVISILNDQIVVHCDPLALFPIRCVDRHENGIRLFCGGGRVLARRLLCNLVQSFLQRGSQKFLRHFLCVLAKRVAHALHPCRALVQNGSVLEERLQCGDRRTRAGLPGQTLRRFRSKFHRQQPKDVRDRGLQSACATSKTDISDQLRHRKIFKWNSLRQNFPQQQA